MGYGPIACGRRLSLVWRGLGDGAATDQVYQAIAAWQQAEPKMAKKSIVGDVIDFRGFVYGPVNEMGVVALFSKISEVASVTLNGTTTGPVWTPPLELDVTRWLKPGTNLISINVANLALNGFLGTPDRDLSSLRK